MSDYDSARDDLRHSILYSFGSKRTIALADSTVMEVLGYIRCNERDGRVIYTLLTDADLPPHSTMIYKDMVYSLVADTQQSQLIREYTLNQARAGVSNGWSEYDS